MARVTKEADVRRDELLDVALDLCMTVGFEAMSVEQVTRAAGVAKGTFYHYFASKQDLLLQLVDRFGDELLTYLETAMRKVEGDAIERLLALTGLSAAWKYERLQSTMTYVPFLYKEENYTLRHKLYSAWMARTRPLLLDIVEQGASEGAFNVADPDATTDIVLSLWFDFANRLWEERALAAPNDEIYTDILMRGVEAMWVAEERVLGAPEGSLRVSIDPAALSATRAYFTPSSDGADKQASEPIGRRQ
jgi:AcrR family transcriptional regulator